MPQQKSILCTFFAIFTLIFLISVIPDKKNIITSITSYAYPQNQSLIYGASNQADVLQQLIWNPFSQWTSYHLLHNLFLSSRDKNIQNNRITCNKFMKNITLMQQYLTVPTVWLHDKITYNFLQSHNAKYSHPEIFKVFQKIKQDLGIKRNVRLHIMYDNFNFNGTTIHNVFGLYILSTNTIYLSPLCLEYGPIAIISTMIHEIEHYRQFNSYPNSFHPATSCFAITNKSELSLCEYYADQAIAKQLQCYCCLHACAITSLHLDHELGYFHYFNYIPYIIKNLYLGKTCTIHDPINQLKGLITQQNYTLEDYLPRIPIKS